LAPQVQVRSTVPAVPAQPNPPPAPAPQTQPTQQVQRTIQQQLQQSQLLALPPNFRILVETQAQSQLPPPQSQLRPNTQVLPPP